MVYEIVVTEVTLYNRLRCVAGYERANGRMIRPEPGPGEFWPLIVCGPGTTFHPGHVVRFNGHKPETDLPHRIEDVVVAGDPVRAGALGPDAFKAVLNECAALNPKVVFEHHLVVSGARAYVPAGSPCGSLACLTMDAGALVFSDDVYEDHHKLRVGVTINGRPLQLPVAAKDLKQVFGRKGVQAVRDLAPKNGPVQVRLGLARPFADIPDKCYLQVNGIHAL